MTFFTAVSNTDPYYPAAMAEMLEHIPVGIMQVDNDLHISYVNAAIYKTFMHPGQNLLGVILWDAFPGLRGSIFEETYYKVKESGKPIQFGAAYSPLKLWLEILATPTDDGMTIAITNVSQEKRLEDSRRTSEATLNAFLDASPDAALLLDRDGEVLAANQLAVERMKTTHQALIGSNGYASLPIELAEELRKHQQQVIIDNMPSTYESYSENCFYENTLVPVKNDQGIISRIAIFSRDITERKKHEAELEAAYAVAEEERNRLSAVMEALPIGLVITDENGGVVSSNGMDKQIWGTRPPTESIADYTEYQAWWVADNKPVAPDEWASALTLRTGEAVIGQILKILRFDGSTGVILNSAAPIQNNDGEIIGSAVAIEDITELHLAQQSLEHERALMMTIIENLPVPLALLNAQGEVFNGNESFRALLKRHQLNDINDIKFLDPLSKLPVPWEETPLASALNGETIRSQELLIASSEADVTPIMLNATPVIFNDQIATVVAVFQDITSLKELDHAKDQFLTVLSHELQTPLTNILGYVDLAMVSDTLEMYRKTIPVIERNSKRQARLVNELLDMSKLLQGRPECNPRVIDLCQLTKNTIDMMQINANQAGLELVFNPVQQELAVFVDEKRIAECIEHLISNSIKFTPYGGRIEISCNALPHAVQLTISDNGRGIRPDQLPNLFQPFQQLTRDETTGGLGLGLAIIHGYISWHGGTITAHSEGLNQGCRIVITLPLNSYETQQQITQRQCAIVRK